jgi:hypothetical protein
MADLLVTAEELALFMGETGLDEQRATFLLEMATGEVQAAAGQRLVLVEDDPFELFGYPSRWLELPERPVNSVASLTIDGGAELVDGVDYKRPARSARLFRSCGWSACPSEPSIVAGVYTHGYPVHDQRLQFARSATIGVAKLALTVPAGVVSESIDDYRVQYAQMAAWAMEQSPHLRASLARYYGQRAGMVRIG